MTEEDHYDTTRPFLGIVPDAFEGEYFDQTHQVYLINPLDKPLSNVYERLGGFFSGDDGVLEAAPKTYGPYHIALQSAQALETSSLDELDEFVCWWHFKYELDGQTVTQGFSAGKALRDTRPAEDCPVLGRFALVVMPCP